MWRRENNGAEEIEEERAVRGEIIAREMKSGWMRKDEEKYCGDDWTESAKENWEVEEKVASGIRHGSISEIYGEKEEERGRKTIQSDGGSAINLGVFYEWAKTSYREKAITHTHPEIPYVRISTAKLFLGIFATVHRTMMEIDRRTLGAYPNHFKD